MMTDEAKRCVEALRMCPVSGFRCEDCPVYNPGFPCQNELNAADIIEELLEELERVKHERDAAIKDIEYLLSDGTTACDYCKRFDNCEYDSKQDVYCNPIWRGVQE